MGAAKSKDVTRLVASICDRWSPCEDAVMRLRQSGFLTAGQARDLHERIAKVWQGEIKKALREARQPL